MANRPATISSGHYLNSMRQTSLFSGLSDEEIACFQTSAQGICYKNGKILYIQEEQAASFYVICSGWIKLFHTTQNGEEIIFDLLTSGQIFGESSIFEQGHHTSSAQAIEDVQLISIPTHILKEQIKSNSALAMNLLSSMSRHHRHHFGESALNAMQNAPQRIGGFLLRLCPRDKKTDVIIHLPYDKSLIATVLRVKGATFSRALNILRQKTGIAIKGSCVKIASVEQLTKFVYGDLTSEYRPEKMWSTWRTSQTRPSTISNQD